MTFTCLSHFATLRPAFHHMFCAFIEPPLGGWLARSFTVKLKTIVFALLVTIHGAPPLSLRGDDGWKLPNLNPFSKSDPTTTKSTTTKPSGSTTTAARPQASSKSGVM